MSARHGPNGCLLVVWRLLPLPNAKARLYCGFLEMPATLDANIVVAVVEVVLATNAQLQSLGWFRVHLRCEFTDLSQAVNSYFVFLEVLAITAKSALHSIRLPNQLGLACRAFRRFLHRLTFF